MYSINDHDDPLERMLAVLRFTFSKDIRHVVRCLHSPASLQCSSTDPLFAARQTLQAIQLRSRREFPHALGRYPNLI